MSPGGSNTTEKRISEADCKAKTELAQQIDHHRLQDGYAMTEHIATYLIDHLAGSVAGPLGLNNAEA